MLLLPLGATAREVQAIEQSKRLAIVPVALRESINLRSTTLCPALPVALLRAHKVNVGA
jgi:hypothetical protein